MVDQNIPTSFNKVYDETYRKVCAYVTSKCGNTFDIADILQEVYLEVYSVMAKKGLDYIRNEEAFVMLIAKSKIYKHYSFSEKLKNIIPLFSKSIEDEEVNVLDYEILNCPIEDDIITKILNDEIWSIVKTKDQNTIKIFYLFYSLEFTIPEIAKNLSISQSSVKNKLYITVNEIRGIYEKGGGTYE